ncbi:type IV toxin-antitoxin system AbiEi family antitoxin domain-containing protein [Hoyosella altamirensis]|uniref:AbiEi antitoxin N-terminal domain-containing protein n=1 Tax=Hoyosella altamirensis TaxID=616997 RepID=A0A839RGH1_9ACTN|nr:type IV toxin-antitoxin system AbiEi family antitoxin domain-containing protein [Hoyosella altamirensis]MBB3035822.1 hypothetical protein [Hoyosella altamirensis]
MTPDQHLTRKSAHARGITDEELTARCRSGQLTRLHRGLYVPASAHDSMSPAARHMVAARQVLSDARAGAALSHSSAALLHGLPVWGVPLDRVHLTADAASGGKVSKHRALHTSPLPPEHLTCVDGHLATTIARTVVDIARTAGFEAAVVVGDAALRRGTSRDELRSVLASMRRWKGLPVARKVVDFLDGRSESVGESRSRVALDQFPLPPIEVQYPVRDENGFLVARADFAVPSLRVLGEFDGRIKYGRALNPGQPPEEVLWREKQREDKARDLDWQFARWIWRELSTPEFIYAKILRAAERAGRRL